MKKIIITVMVLVTLLISVGGCFVPWDRDGRDGRDHRDGGDRDHDRGRGPDRDGGRR